jgi:pimeloyl-ACP methyl ester carboxylesterase
MPKRAPEATEKTGSSAEPPPTISPRWLLTALALTLLAAALCGYAALCLLFYQGQWQMLFHPSRAITSTPASAGMAYEEVRFDVTDAGLPQLNGWWVPAKPGSKYVTATVLYLHGARGSLSDCVPALLTLHGLGINVFAFDYRGFGHSAGAHPTERLATEDSIAAWTYLTETRHIPPRDLIVFGDGAGANFAAHFAAQFAPAAAILEDPNPSARQIFAADARARILPLWLLQNDKLDPIPDLAHSHTPLLFLDIHGDTSRTRALFEAAPYPKQYYGLRASPESTFADTLSRFLDEVLR